jgi:hypothetical protein
MLARLVGCLSRKETKAISALFTNISLLVVILRGHVSKFVATSVISVDSGKVLDTEVCSTFCHACSQHSKDDKKSTEYKEWYAKHKSNCSVNFEGTRGGMEVAEALEIFNRSEERNSLRYVKYIGDGDSRAFKAIIEVKPYEGIEIIKLECIGHIQKTMGKRLRNFRIEMKGKKLIDGKGVSGKGRLTDKQIDSLQFYCGKAIRDHVNNLANMKRSVWATFLHKASTNERPQHLL